MKTAKQYAALPYIVFADHIKVLLITTRRSRRWIIPKGWPEKRLDARTLAALEAFEEAGLKGRTAKQPIGKFSCVKRLYDNSKVICHVDVYPLLVSTQYLDWPEKGQRELRWVKLKKASKLVAEKDLARLIRDFAPGKRPNGAKTPDKVKVKPTKKAKKKAKAKARTKTKGRLRSKIRPSL